MKFTKSPPRWHENSPTNEIKKSFFILEFNVHKKQSKLFLLQKIRENKNRKQCKVSERKTKVLGEVNNTKI